MDALILPVRDPCSYTCEHGDSIPCPAGPDSLAPPDPAPPEPTPALVELRALLEHALVRLAGEQTIKTRTPKNSEDIELLEKKLKIALSSLKLMKEKLKTSK